MVTRITLALALLASNACAFRLELPSTSGFTTSRRAAVSGGVLGLLTALPAFADEENISPTKAKILAAKKASAEKLGARGQTAPEAIRVEISFPAGGGSSTEDLFTEANALRAQINELKSINQLSKAQSAKLNQLRQKEGMARERAQNEFNRQEAKAAKKLAGAQTGNDGGDKFKKITGIKLPTL